MNSILVLKTYILCIMCMTTGYCHSKGTFFQKQNSSITLVNMMTQGQVVRE